MPLVPNLLERLVLLHLNRGPAPLLEVFGAGGLKAVALALDLGLFEEIADVPTAVHPLAGRLDCDERGLEALLGLLVALGYVERRGERYANTEMTTRWLTDREGTNFGPFLSFWDAVVLPYWTDQLAHAVREGRPETTLYDWLGDDAEGWAVTQAGFEASARVLVDDVVAALPPASRVLDVGGGHGLYAVRTVQRDPDASAVVVDRPVAVDAAESTATDGGVSARVGTIAGDFLADDLGEGFDLALCCNVVHGLSPEENRRLLGRVADAVDSGGHVAVLDQFEGSAPTPVGRAGLALVDLAYLATIGGRTYPADDVEEWLTEAGFEDVERTTWRRSPGVTLLVARRRRRRPSAPDVGGVRR